VRDSASTFVPGKDSYLKVRLDALRQAQNADGGWGYFFGKDFAGGAAGNRDSWLEPTAYAALALHGEPAAERAWKLLTSWQMADGSLKPSPAVTISSWATSLFVTIAVARNDWGPATRKGVDWLLGSYGVESNWINTIASKIGILKSERDLSLKSWPWKPGTSGWVEPTAHAIVALQRAATKWPSSELTERVHIGQQQLADTRGRDGGWNYGSPAALGVDLPSYPETTALALLGLQKKKGLENAFDLAWKMMHDTPSPLARAWLVTSMRLHGMTAPEDAGDLTADVMITAVEALSAAQGNWKLMSSGDFA
jgi:hypothetical protein